MAGRAAAVLGAALAVPLVGYAFIGSFARYTADDYCWAGVLRTEGFLRAQMLWYTGYSPRYAFTFLVNLVELAGPAIVPALPAAAIVVWLATLTWTFLQFKIRLGRLSTTTSALLLAEATALGSLQTAPDMAQSLYWQTGMLTYLLPLVLATFLIGWIRRAIDQPRLEAWALGISGLVTFVAGGLSETYLIPQNVALTLALLACVLVAPRAAVRRLASAHLAVALAGGVLALLAILVAPSTASRVGGSPADHLAGLVGGHRHRRLPGAAPGALLLARGAVLRGTPRGPGRGPHAHQPPLVPAGHRGCRDHAAVLLLPVVLRPERQSTGAVAHRPGTMLIGYLVFAGYSLGGRLKIPELGRVAVAVVLAIVQVGHAAGGLPEQAAAAQQAAARWDTTDQQIRASRDAGSSRRHRPPTAALSGRKLRGLRPRQLLQRVRGALLRRAVDRRVRRTLTNRCGAPPWRSERSAAWIT